jgi:hypothetical protein
MALASTAEAVCTFRIPLPAAIAFSPNLDPSNAITRTASTVVTVRCTGAVTFPSSWGFSGNNGINPNLQLKHVTPTDFIPYSVGNPPACSPPCSGRTRSYLVTATIPANSYQAAYAGAYNDALIITVNP